VARVLRKERNQKSKVVGRDSVVAKANEERWANHALQACTKGKEAQGTRVENERR